MPTKRYKYMILVGTFLTHCHYQRTVMPKSVNKLLNKFFNLIYYGALKHLRLETQ